MYSFYLLRSYDFCFEKLVSFIYLSSIWFTNIKFFKFNNYKFYNYPWVFIQYNFKFTSTMKTLIIYILIIQKSKIWFVIPTNFYTYVEQFTYLLIVLWCADRNEFFMV